MREINAEIVVVGAGPAGIAATVRAAESLARNDNRASVVLVDDNAVPGGQIWRASRGLPITAQRWLERLRDLERQGRANVLTGATVAHADGPRRLYADCADGPVALNNQRLILATGAQELFLPFPGWTLPGVYGAGGLQALVKGGLDITGQRVLIAGSGPLLWTVAADLRRRGAEIVGIAEQAPLGRLFRFGAGLATHPNKLSQSLRMAPALGRMRRFLGTWPVRAQSDEQTGGERLKSVVLTNGQRETTLDCDALACSFGLVPDSRLAALLGCLVNDGRVAVDQKQQTSVDDVWAAGEPTAIGGVDAALLEGEIAGLAAAGSDDEAATLARRRARHDAFTHLLANVFSLRDELRHLAEDDTVVCRCEDAHWRDLRDATCAIDAKLRSRCGMGPCQGRVCSPALAFLKSFDPNPAVRPPLFPVPLSFWAAMDNQRQSTP